jgi:hypothetical protein
LATILELTDQRTSWTAHFESEVLWARSRAREFLSYPKMIHCQGFPDWKTCARYVDCNSAYQRHIRMLLEVRRRADLVLFLAEAAKLARIWTLVLVITQEQLQLWERRRALNELRELIGREAFYAKQLPPPVPVWRFEERY